MKEHKYRAWEKNLKEIIPVYNIDFEAKMINKDIAWRMFDEIELMEYTNLKDKNNNEIYSGYIVKALNRNYDCRDDREDYFQTFEVRYLNGCYMFGAWNAHEFFNKFMYIEVIGNIYENFQLLQFKERLF